MPDDILGTAAIRRGISPVRVATGEHVANRVIFKGLLQAEAIDAMQIDACRVAGVNENLANLLRAAKFGVPVCPHAGGVGLCEIVQHLSFFDYAAVSGTMDRRSIEWIDHLHEHFLDPAVVVNGRYLAPSSPGASTQMGPSQWRSICSLPARPGRLEGSWPWPRGRVVRPEPRAVAGPLSGIPVLFAESFRLTETFPGLSRKNLHDTKTLREN